MIDSGRYDEPFDELVQKMERGICQFLISSSLADHLGDIRGAEEYLWQALGFERGDFRSKMYETEREGNFRPTRELLIDGGYFDLLPDYAQGEPEDD